MKTLGEPTPRALWSPPIQIDAYDRTLALCQNELKALEQAVGHRLITPHSTYESRLRRLFHPLDDVVNALGEKATESSQKAARQETRRVMVREMYRRGTSFWAWSSEEWLESMETSWETFNLRYGWSGTNQRYARSRCIISVIAYFFCAPFPMMPLAERFEIGSLAKRVFGRPLIDRATERIITVLGGWGYRKQNQVPLRTCVSYLLLLNHSPFLDDLTSEVIEAASRNGPSTTVQRFLFQVSCALVSLNIIEKTTGGVKRYEPVFNPQLISEEWLSWCERWRHQTTLQPSTVQRRYSLLLCIGRWLKIAHADVTNPTQWTYELAAEFVRAVTDLTIGAWADPRNVAHIPSHRIGQPIGASAKAQYLATMRTFLLDCQQWNWIPTSLSPDRAFRIPPSVQKLIGPNPRIIDKAFWAKILWAAMNLQEEDLPLVGNEYNSYPIEMARAVAIVWCFAALRSNEIARLRVGCIRWQYEDVTIVETGESLPKDAVCFLDIPVNKTSTAYAKPVSITVGKYVSEWEKVRPKDQLSALDTKTGEVVQFLFSYRGRRMSHSYINRLIPVLCQKAGIPEQDSRGAITSHRARATIASMLYNAKDPLDIFQLKEYLGHKDLSSTQHYAKVDPTKLANQVAKAGYLEQNMATIEVLLNQEAVLSGAAARGEVWKYYDLGHGYCTNDFWADCKHRMACARCPFYRPKDSLKDQLVEGQANLVRMLEYVQLTEEEQLLVTEGIELHRELVERLADIPTPTGQTPHELEAQQREHTLIPLKHVQRFKRKARAKQ